MKHRIVFIYLICSGFAAVLDPSNVQKKGFYTCKNGTVYVERSSIRCHSTAKLEQECQYNEQCTVPNSFCGLSTQNEFSPICVCDDGHILSHDKSVCLARQKCSNIEFNSANQPSAECGLKQFCREGLCLCMPKHEFNHLGECFPTVAALEDLDSRISVLNIRLTTLANRMGVHETTVFVLVVALIISVASIIYLAYRLWRKPEYEEIQPPKEEHFENSKIYDKPN